jgi:hypothetical protein
LIPFPGELLSALSQFLVGLFFVALSPPSNHPGEKPLSPVLSADLHLSLYRTSMYVWGAFVIGVWESFILKLSWPVDNSDAGWIVYLLCQKFAAAVGKK